MLCTFFGSSEITHWQKKSDVQNNDVGGSDPIDRRGTQTLDHVGWEEDETKSLLDKSSIFSLLDVYPLDQIGLRAKVSCLSKWSRVHFN